MTWEVSSLTSRAVYCRCTPDSVSGTLERRQCPLRTDVVVRHCAVVKDASLPG